MHITKACSLPGSSFLPASASLPHLAAIPFIPLPPLSSLILFLWLLSSLLLPVSSLHEPHNQESPHNHPLGLTWCLSLLHSPPQVTSLGRHLAPVFKLFPQPPGRLITPHTNSSHLRTAPQLYEYRPRLPRLKPRPPQALHRPRPLTENPPTPGRKPLRLAHARSSQGAGPCPFRKGGGSQLSGSRDRPGLAGACV